MTAVRAPSVPVVPPAFVLLACALCGCGGPGGSLDGSLSDAYDLSFDTVRARLYASDLAIEYVNEKDEVVVRLTIKRAVREPKPGETYDLVTGGDVTGTSGGVEIPRFTEGEVALTAYMPKEQAQVRGRFSAVFKAGTTELSLSGDFATRVEIVAPR